LTNVRLFITRADYRLSYLVVELETILTCRNFRWRHQL